MNNIHFRWCLPLLFLISFCSYGQLPNFTLNVTANAQTCLGNGSLGFAVSGTTPGSSVAYEVFLLPNTTTPVATVNSSTAANLVAGNYLVVATQTLGTQSNTANANAIIENQVVPLVYTLSTSVIDCDDEGAITVNVISGTAVSYEITDGPETRPVQTSNVFTGLAFGLYEVRVYDNCGDAVVVSIQIAAITTNLLIDHVWLYYTPGCDTIDVTNNYGVLDGGQILWPLTFEYTVYPPGGGAPVIVTEVVESGFTYNENVTEIPFYDALYSYNLKITDACGNSYTENNNIVYLPQNWTLDASFDPCEFDELILKEFQYITFPVTVTFETAPAGFNPVDYNPNHPVFDGNSGTEIHYFQSGLTMPPGNYSVKLTDACGRETIKQIAASAFNDAFNLEAIDGDCGFGGMKLCMGGKGAVVKEITAGPPDFSTTYPQDILGDLLENGDIDVNNLPPGTYTIHVIDECGNEYTEDFFIDSIPFVPQTHGFPGCGEGNGSVRIDAASPISSIVITEAPDTFTEALPYDVMFNVLPDFRFNMDSLPEGDYVFTIIDECGEFIVPYTVTGYEVYSSTYEIVPHCGSFDLYLAHFSNGTIIQSFWLQKYDEATGLWVHPLTGVPYSEGNAPDFINSVLLDNFQTNINLAYTGQFRILEVYHTFGSGSPVFIPCVSVLDEFTFTGGPDIINAYSFPCDDNTAEVVLEAVGVPPLTYTITTRNGESFAVNNGTSPHFDALQAGVYNFQVSDNCGNIRNIVYDINTLEPLAIQPYGFCDGIDSNLSVPDFDFLVYEWWKDGAPATVLSATASLDFPAFNPAEDTGSYMVHITSTNPGSCIDLTLQYVVTPNEFANAGNDNSVSLCNEGNTIDLTAYLSGDFDEDGSWTDANGSGGLDGSMLSSGGINPGTYQYIYTVTSTCGEDDDAIVTILFKSQPETPALGLMNPVCEGSDVQLSAPAIQGASYSWTGPGNFASAQQYPVLDNIAVAASGIYFLTVTMPDSDCPSLPATVVVQVKTSPQFTIQGPSALCEGQTGILSVVPANFDAGSVTYQWFHDDVLMPTVTSGIVIVFEPGTYRVTIDYDGCTSTQESVIALNTNAFVVEAAAGCVNDEYMIAVTNIDDIPEAVVLWAGPEGFTSNEPQAQITGGAEGEYVVTVTNADGCTVQAAVQADDTTCGIPRGISPNGDTLNEFFDLSNLDVTEISIFNRYGSQVYTAKNYKKEWYGQSNDGDLPTGTYYYMITLSAGKRVTGWVYLQRETE